MQGQQNDKYTEMHGQQNDKYTEMHGQQNDKYTEMHGQQNFKIYESVLTEDEEFLSMTHLTLQMFQKEIYVFKSEYLFVDKTSTECSIRIKCSVQLCSQVCAGRETTNSRWAGDIAPCNQPERCGE